MGFFDVVFKMLNGRSSKVSVTIEMAHEMYKQKDYNRAIQVINELIKQNDKDAFAYFFRANVKEDMSDHIGAIKDYEIGLTLQSWYSIYHQIGVNYDALKKFKEADVAYTKSILLKDEQDNQDKAFNSLSNFMYGIVWRVPYEKLYTNRAKIRLETNNLQEAREDCEKALSFNSNYANTHFISGLYFLKVQDVISAKKALSVATQQGHKKAPILLSQIS